jgi:uncharacterized protein (TIRG00374 family)
MKQALKIAFSILLAAFFLWLAFREIEWEEFFRALRTANPIWLIVTVFILVLSCLPRAWRWTILLRPIHPHIPILAAFRAVLIGYAGNSVFPRAGEIARVVALRQKVDVPFSTILATVVVERILDLLAFAIIFLIVVLTVRDKINTAFADLTLFGYRLLELMPLELFSLLLTVGILCILIFLGLLSLYGKRFLPLVQNLLSHLSPTFADRTVDILEMFLEGMASIRSLSGYLGIFVSTVVLNTMYWLSIFLPFYSFQLHINYGLNAFDALVVLTIATIGVILPTPGGAGTYHLFCQQALVQLYGVSVSEAIAFATVVHALALVAFLIFGGPALLRMVWNKETKKENVE